MLYLERSGVSDANWGLRSDAASKFGLQVQPFFKPFMGNGCMARKWDLKVYLAVASINPPRFYMWNVFDVIVARKLYDPAAPASDYCVHDTHARSARGECYEPCVVDTEGWPKDGHHSYANDTHAVGRMMNLSTYVALSALPSNTTAGLSRRVHDMLSRVFYHPDTLAGFAGNSFTTAIESSGASCFHWLRADMGVAEGLEPVLYEINDLPETSNSNAKDRAKGKFRVEYRSHRDLFHMLELDKPTRLAREERGKWEHENAGGWRPITRT